jgi:hypothetical protein
MNNNKQTTPGFVGALDPIFGHLLVHQSVKSNLHFGARLYDFIDAQKNSSRQPA